MLLGCVLFFGAALALLKSNLNIPGRFNNYLSQVLIFTFKNTCLAKGFFGGLDFFLLGLFFTSLSAGWLVAMQGSLLSPRELSIPVSVRRSNEEKFCNLKAEHSAFWTKSTSLIRPCR